MSTVQLPVPERRRRRPRPAHRRLGGCVTVPAWRSLGCSGLLFCAVAAAIVLYFLIEGNQVRPPFAVGDQPVAGLQREHNRGVP